MDPGRFTPFVVHSRTVYPFIHFFFIPTDDSPLPQFHPRTIHPPDVSPPGRFTPRTFHPPDVSPSVRFTPRTFHPPDVSPPAMFTPRNVHPLGIFIIFKAH